MGAEFRNEYEPDYVSPPGDTLRETLDVLGMSQKELAERTGRPIKTINEIVMGKAAITTETALQLERALGIPARLWMNREREYREHLARLQDAERLASETGALKLVPVRDMMALGWIEQTTSKVDQLRATLRFFGVATAKELGQVSLSPVADFRMSSRFKSHPGAIAAWLRKGELDARDIPCKAYDPGVFQKQLATIRELTRKPDRIADVIPLAAEAGVAVTFVPPPKRVTASGAARWLSRTKALIQLSLRYKADDQVWFSFFHEAGHILRHGKKRVFVDKLHGRSMCKTPGQEEVEANAFASEMLIPPRELGAFYGRADHRSEKAIKRFAKHIGISEGIVVGRMQHDKRIPWSWHNSLKIKYDWA